LSSSEQLAPSANTNAANRILDRLDVIVSPSWSGTERAAGREMPAAVQQAMCRHAARTEWPSPVDSSFTMTTSVTGRTSPMCYR
jgi:hypothetical protein